ncbi:pullulanase-type alpha-1,6-glucosidase [Psychromonas ossibalaenae]|uniref:pullulanase-type alpha-1,6-glucosidase n=1 Tax=Psychromonas ossibalaenae TaxID=444922 RepID=UPI000366E3F6|nr:pullulanase-type alpha-1,6-glucosidase [Psychromonas ossibalaenae]
MKNKLNKLALTTMPRICAMAIVASLALLGCNDSSSNDVVVPSPDPTPTPDPTPDFVTAGDKEAVIYLLGENSLLKSAAEKTLHVWNNDECSALDGDKISGFEQWDEGVTASGEDAAGIYWVLPLTTQGAEDCINFIVRDGLGGQSGNMKLEFSIISDRQGFVPADYSTILDHPDDTPPVSLEGAYAHWVDANTLLWDQAKSAAKVEIYHSKAVDIKFSTTSQTISGGTVITLDDGTASDSVKAKFPHIKDNAAFSVPGNAAAIKDVLKGQLIAVARNEKGEITALTKIQIPGVLDALYTGSDDESSNADKQALGAVVDSGNVTFNVWAPTAQKVELFLFSKADAGKVETGYPKVMSDEDGDGVYTLAADGSAMNKYYRYRVTVYHPTTDNLETFDVTDPYSLSLSENSLFSQVVDMDDESLKPANWDDYQFDVQAKATDAIIYESHIRDFSNSDTLGSAENNGKYLAFTENGRASMKHLQSLRDSGLTYFHLMPAFDIATVDEDPEKLVNLNDTVEKLCSINAAAGVCSSADPSQTLQSVLESYDPQTDSAQALMNDMRALDSFNWGYDPYHYTVPEGSYASDANGSKRIEEFRQMVQALHDMGLKVVMDVVYNHTNAAGNNEKSVLDKVVPGYYHRLNSESGAVEQSTCCDNTASEHTMMEKLMIDSLVTWAEDYKIDSFRFDLMGHHMKTNMEKALEAVQKVNPSTYFYGEGWNFGEVESGKRGENAIQWNMAGTGIGTFSDRLRDAVRGGSPFDSGEGLRENKGFANAGSDFADSDKTEDLNRLTDLVRLGMAANLKDYMLVDYKGALKRGQDIDYNGQHAGYAEQPQETLNYASKHDNQTLWDNNQYKTQAGTTSADRVRMHNIALSTVLLGQGVPFLHMGSELLRSKSMQRDSYDSGDWYNRVDFDLENTDLHNNWNVGLPREDKDGDNYDVIKEVIKDSEARPSAEQIQLASSQFQELLKIRTTSPLFNLETAADIIARVSFHNTGTEQVSGVVVMSIDDGTGVTSLDSNYDAVVIVINATEEDQTMPVTGASGFTLHPIQQNSVDQVVKNADFADGKFTVPALTTAVFVKTQGKSQGAGLPVSAKEL